MSSPPYELSNDDYLGASEIISYRITGNGCGIYDVIDKARCSGRTEELLICVVDAYTKLAYGAGADLTVVESLASRISAQISTRPDA